MNYICIIVVSVLKDYALKHMWSYMHLTYLFMDAIMQVFEPNGVSLSYVICEFWELHYALDCETPFTD